MPLSLPAKVRLRGRKAFDAWLREAHDGQTPPPDWLRTWYAQGPRGSGKTRLGAEAAAFFMQTLPPGDYGLVAPTFADARDTMVEHRKSGLLRALGGAVATWNRSVGEIRLVNGSWVFLDGANEGAERIQGKEFRLAWCDEIGLWRRVSAWQESLEFAVRADPALIIATGTPKGKKGVVKLLLEEGDRCVFTFPKLTDNEANLAASVVEGWRRRYAGTRLGRQELEGEIIADVAGALWTLALIEEARVQLAQVADLGYPSILRERTVVAVDPATTANEESSDETGIVVVRLVEPDVPTLDALGWVKDLGPHALVLDDLSGIYTPTEWANVAVGAYEKYGADRIVAEKNQGGDMVENTIRQVAPNVPYTGVTASKGKRTRAEPISAIYEQRRVHHVDALPDLESQMTTWVPGEDSPDRMDALVWAMTDLFVEDTGGEFAFATNPAEVLLGRPPSITGGLLDRVM